MLIATITISPSPPTRLPTSSITYNAVPSMSARYTCSGRVASVTPTTAPALHIINTKNPFVSAINLLPDLKAHDRPGWTGCR